MPIPEELINQLKCCLNDDGHIVRDPVVFECGGNACRICINELKLDSAKCYNCAEIHEKKDLINQQKLVDVENIVNSNLNDLFEYVKMNLEKTYDLLKGNI